MACFACQPVSAVYQQTTALEDARKDATAAVKAYNRVKARRQELFMRAFDHIRDSIDYIYKQLTRSSVHPLGGTAYLSLESEDEPYLHGIKYTAMPPTKRFRDMEQLSGMYGLNFNHSHATVWIIPPPPTPATTNNNKTNSNSNNKKQSQSVYQAPSGMDVGVDCTCMYADGMYGTSAVSCQLCITYQFSSSGNILLIFFMC